MPSCIQMTLFKKPIISKYATVLCRIFSLESTVNSNSKHYLMTTFQGRRHTFKSGGTQAAKIILGPFDRKKWRAQPYFYYSLRQKLRGPGHYRPIVRLRPCSPNLADSSSCSCIIYITISTFTSVRPYGGVRRRRPSASSVPSRPTSEFHHIQSSRYPVRPLLSEAKPSYVYSILKPQCQSSRIPV